MIGEQRQIESIVSPERKHMGWISHQESLKMCVSMHQMIGLLSEAVKRMHAGSRV